MTSQPDTFEAMGKRWRDARKSKTVFLQANEYTVLESCADELASLAQYYVSKERVRELIAKSVREIGSTLAALKLLYYSPGRGGPANCQLTWPEIRIYVSDITRELGKLEAALGEPMGRNWWR